MAASAEHLRLFELLQTRGAYQFASYVSASQYNLAYDLARRHFRPQGRVLDWGCGEGHFSLFLHEDGYEVTSFCLESEPGFAVVMSDAAANCHVVDPNAVRELPFAPATFDAITSIGVLEHVRETGGDEVASLRELRRVLRPGGSILLYHFPNRWSWIEALTRFLPNKHHHEYRYRSADIRRLAAEAGYDVVLHRRYGLLPRLMFRSLPNWGPLVTAFNVVDRVLSRLAPWITQNHAVVLKPTS